MRFKRHMKLEEGLQQIDIVPLINMLFLLLIFFAFSSGFAVQSGIKVNLPKSVTSEAVKRDDIEIIVSGENTVYLNAKFITMDQLKILLKQASGRKQSVLIKSDTHASLGRIVEIWDMCRDLGVAGVNIATNQQ